VNPCLVEQLECGENVKGAISKKLLLYRTRAGCGCWTIEQLGTIWGFLDLRKGSGGPGSMARFERAVLASEEATGIPRLGLTEPVGVLGVVGNARHSSSSSGSC
jgi:hypothetical protein